MFNKDTNNNDTVHKEPLNNKTVNKETAEKEVLGWLDYKKIFKVTREANKENIEFLEELVCEGVLTFDPEDYVITQKLIDTIGGVEKISELKYRPRINDKMIRPYMRKVKNDDGDGRLNAYICCLTVTDANIIRELDSRDKKVALTIATFFL